ncbi:MULTISPECIES: nitroreductase family deazaflavin-dependent oxidoreductase [Prauserella salsuginis group]|uniref:Nitroreductase family deazaflavin-dependent oxidoreductase n=1 Tax=Prauserella salsuginis TaxID=387889 RepID=A0ABW6G7I5_9PSEU|nr:MULTISPECIES: nitroreductase family deazaflavin-dependent oxidoreductase [Prauserella salsuginis group]MCR3719496.1 deazaflavin-dependent oxidoreductase, nitroreductase family [Prauserella flava]MCR3735490.1 deazaflavin-dependent oxidoreductase, nitroreductase family [Prauserella salsuginis]
MERISDAGPPSGWRRALARAPIVLYRRGFGGLLGRRLMYLVHTGRRSGRRREVVLEVVTRDAGSITACSGFGTKAAWYRNVIENPSVKIQNGRLCTSATAVPLDVHTGVELMSEYAGKYPKLATRLARVMGYRVDGGDDDFRALGREVRFVRFDHTA